MNWKKKTNRKTLLDKYNIKFPYSFNNAFFVLFDELEKEKEILKFLEKMNKAMEKEKGNGYVITFNEIIYYRKVNTYIDEGSFYLRDSHHVIPKSRLNNERKHKKEKIGLPVKFHEAWHICFANLYGKEIIYLMDRFFKELVNKKREIFFACLTQIQKKIKENY